MITPAQHWLVFAILAQATLTFVLLFCLPIPRFSAARDKKVRLGEDGVPIFPKRTQQLGAAVNNLFQTPMLFFVIALLAMQLGDVTLPFAILAWVFVAFRVLHAAVYVISNFIPLRFSLFVVSAAALLAMWVMVAMNVLSNTA